MSLYSALRSGVTAMQAQTQAMSMVSNNIANLNTNGFKRTTASFSTLVSSGNSSSSFSAGSVISRPNLKATALGQITKTSSNTDLSVNGQGFLAVAKQSSVTFNTNTGYWENNGEVLYTRLGDFTRNKDGLLENSAGNVLLAWPRNTADTGYDQSNLEGQLRPVTISDTTGAPQPTTTINLNANLSPNLNQPDVFSTTISMFDSQGTGHVMNVNFIRSADDSRTFEMRLDMSDTSAVPITNYDNGTSVGAGNVNELIRPTLMSATQRVDNGVQRVYLQYDAPLTDLSQADLTTLRNEFSVGYDTLATPPTAIPLTVDNVSIDGGRLVLELSDAIPPRGADGTLSYQNLQIDYTGTTLTGQAIDATTGQFDPNVATPVSVSQFADVDIVDSLFLGTIQFEPDGTISAGGSSMTAAGAGVNNVGTYSVNNFSFMVDYAGDGATKNASGISDDVTVDLSLAAQSGSTGMTSYDSPHAIYTNTQNGSSSASFQSVEISTTGEIEASFDAGDNRKLAQIPVVMFPSANRLEAVDGNAFRSTVDSGTVLLRTAGSSGAGLIASATIEASNVDLASEFTDMIVTQRAYSASTKIITTADEMLEELVRAKR